MRFDSMLYTIGTALDTAHQSGTRVAVLANGHWMAGTITAVDGHGVMLDDNGADQYIVKLDQITAVRVIAEIHEQRQASTDSDEPVIYGPRHMAGNGSWDLKPNLRVLS